MGRREISRREFLRLACVASGGMALAACAPAGTPPPTAPPAAQPTEAPAAAPVETKELIVHWRTDDREMKILQPMWRQFETEFPQYKIKEVYTSEEEHDKKTEMMVAAGTPPALWFCAGMKSQPAYAEEGQLMVLDTFIEKDKYDTADFYEDSATIAKWQNQWIALPISVVPVVLVYNQTLFDQAGIPYPNKNWQDKNWDWDALLEQAKALTKVEGDKTVQFGFGGMHAQRYSPRNFGTNYWSQAGEESRYPEKFENTPELLDAFQFMADLQNKWKVMPTPGQTEALSGGAPNPFMTGKVAMEMNGIWVLPQYAEIKDFKWDVAALPWPRFMGHDLARLDWYYLDALSAFKGVQSPDGAWELLKFHTRPENMIKYPLLTGFIPARRSLAKDFSGLMEQEFKIPPATSQPVIDAAAIESPNQAAMLPHWVEVYEKGIQPSFDNLMLGQISAEQAAKEMEPIVNRILQDTKKAES